MTTDRKVDDLPRILRSRAETGIAHHGEQWAQGVRFAANQIEAALSRQDAQSEQQGAWETIVEMCVVTEAVTPDETDVRGTMNRLIDYHVAIDRDARQPVGHVPVFQVVEGPGEHRPRVTRQLRELPPIGSLLYAAPPAQVDLEQFRDAVVTARDVHQQDADNWRGRKREAIYLEYVAECDRLLALIDQQAGKGVDRG